MENYLWALSCFFLGPYGTVAISGGMAAVLGNTASLLENVCVWGGGIHSSERKSNCPYTAGSLQQCLESARIQCARMNIHERELHLQEASFKWSKCEKKIIAFFSAFSFLPSMGIWHQAHQALSTWAIPTNFPSLLPQTAAARLCAAHYPAIPIRREEIVNVSGAGDRYVPRCFVLSSCMWKGHDRIPLKFHGKSNDTLLLEEETLRMWEQWFLAKLARNVPRSILKARLAIISFAFLQDPSLSWQSKNSVLLRAELLKAK